MRARRFMYTLVVSVAGILAAGTVVSADVIMLTGNNPQVGTFENILFNQAGLADQGFLVQGVTNQTGLIVDFLSSSEIETPSQGQARIIGLGGTTFNDLTIQLNDPLGVYTALIFNIDADADGEVTFEVRDTGGNLISPADPNNPATFNLTGSGQNFFTIYTTTPDLIRSLYMETDVNIVSIEDVAQIRISGAQIIPLPAAVWAGMALFGLMGAHNVRRRLRARA